MAKKNNNTNRNKEKAFILDDSSPFQMQEAYKHLRTNVQFSLPAGECHLIGISSAEQGEGKSTTSLNLAISFAQLGKKVAIIDGDMRLPTIAKKLGLPGTPGLSNYLIGQCTFQEACRIDKVHNMFVIPSGNIPPDPTWLLQSERMRTLVEELKGRLDYVFIDLPPVTVVSDASILSELVYGYLLVVENGTTSVSKVSEMISALKLVDAKILGFVGTRSGKAGSHYKKNSNYYEYK